MSRKKRRKKDEDDIWGFIGALILGGIGLAVLSEIVKPKCPYCGNKIEQRTRVCPYCGTYLEWR